MSNFFIERQVAENDLLACAAYLGERVGSLDGHADAIAKIARIYAEKGEVDLAASLIDAINDPHVRDANLVEIAGKCVELDDDEYAFQLAEAIEEFGLQEQAKIVIAVNQARKGRFEESLETADSLNDPSSALGEIALIFARQGNEEKAREILETIDFPLIRIQVLNELAAIKLKADENEEALQLLEQSLAETENIEFPEEKVQILLDTANRFFAAGNAEKAGLLLDEAREIAETLDDKFRDQTLTQISLALASFGNFEKAGKIPKNIKDLHQTALCLAGIALEYQSKEEPEKALEYLEEAWQTLKSQPDNKIRSSEARFGLWATIAVRFAQFGKEERALEIAQTNPEEGNYHAALTNIAGICTAHGKEDAAKSAINAINDFSTKTFALIGVSDAEAKRDNTDKSLQKLTEAYEMSENIGQLPMRVRALDEIAVRFAERGNKEKAEIVLFESLEKIQLILDQSHQAEELANLFLAYEKISAEIGEKERDILRLMVRKLMNK